MWTIEITARAVPLVGKVVDWCGLYFGLFSAKESNHEQSVLSAYTLETVMSTQ